MKNSIRKISLAITAVIMIGMSSFAQFEGVIKFDKTVGNIKASYKYYVKGDNIRIEEVSEDGTVDGIQLLNLSDNKIYSLSPERKIYMIAPNRRPATEFDAEIEKTGKTKTILNKQCTEIIVTCKEQDRKIVYWVTKDDYNFFIPMLKTLNRKERQSMYFLKIAGMENHFPLLSTEYKLSTGAVESELKTTAMDKKSQSDIMFKIPSGYTKFER